MSKRLVVLISGNGSNLQAILDACESGELNANVVAVVSNKENAYGLERARKNHIPTLTQTSYSFETRSMYDQELAKHVLAFHPDYVVLAGWMRVLSHAFLKCFPNKVINLHPALPHMFPGTQAIERAFQAFQENKIQHTGVMLHFVPDEGVDDGPVIAQEMVPIFVDDTLETLTQRVHEVEHQMLIKALKSL